MKTKKIISIRDKFKKKWDKSPYGIHCIFIPLSKKWGVKVYEEIKHRDYSFFLQRRCLKLGLAPELGYRFSFFLDGKIQKRYCYITEIVDTLDIDKLDVFRSKNKERKHVQEILKKKIKWNFEDDHIENWGIKNDRIIPIDFGPDYLSWD